MRQILRRVWRLIRRREFQAELAEELEFHRAMIAQRLEQNGAAAADAAHASWRALGSVALAQDQAFDVWCPRWLQGIGHDLRYAARMLAATPLVTIVAVLSLAVGIGANTAVFSIIDSLLLRALPVSAPDRLAALSARRALSAGSSRSWSYAAWSYAVWNQIRERPQLADGVLAWNASRLNLAQAGQTDFVDGLWVSGSFFQVLGVPALVGRTLTEADDARGGGPDGPSAVISFGFWQRRLGGAPDIVGRALTVENTPFTIVGVTPRGFFGPDVGRAFDVALPIETDAIVRGAETRLDVPTLSWLSIVLRLAPGQAIDAANRVLEGLEPQIREATMPSRIPQPYRDQYLTGDQRFLLVPAATGNSILRGGYARPLLTMLVLVGVILLIACGNIANLLLARASARRGELSVRCALGASRWRLMRQLFAESALLAAIGAGIGLAFASAGGRLLVNQLSTENNRVFLDLSIDLRVLAFTAVVAIGTALVFGVVPAVRLSTVAPMDALREHGRGAAGSQPQLGGALTTAQVVLSMVLLVAAGLLVRSFLSLAARDVGFAEDRILLVNVSAQRASAGGPPRLLLYDRIRDAALRVPGVDGAAISVATPPAQIGGLALVHSVDVSGGAAVPLTLLGGIANAFGNSVSPGWFNTLGIPLLAGRDFSDRDRGEAPKVAIVNQALVRQFLNGANPLSRTITLTLNRQPAWTIVGLVGDSVYGTLREPATPVVYTPLAQSQSPLSASVSLSVRTAGGSPARLTRPLGAALLEVNPNLAFTFRPLSDQVHAALMQERVVAQVSGFFGVLALLLAGLGLYGVTAYSVTRRRIELGIRMALGATPRAVVRLVLARVSWLVGVGIAVGLVVSVWAATLIDALLYGVEPRDPATLGAAAIMLATVGLIAGWLPAARASRIDPAEVLREG